MRSVIHFAQVPLTTTNRSKFDGVIVDEREEEKDNRMNSRNLQTTCKALVASHTRLLAATGSHHHIQLTTRRWGHSVRLIALEDLPHGKGYQGDVVTVKAGYARNYLIPQKKAIYATPQNFDKFGMVDPEFETEEQRLARLQRESSMDKKAEQHLKEADILKKYLRNKVVSCSRCWRES